MGYLINLPLGNEQFLDFRNNARVRMQSELSNGWEYGFGGGDVWVEREKARDKRRILLLASFSAVVLVIVVAFAITASQRTRLYALAVDTVICGEYEESISILEAQLPKGYKESEALLSLCRAELALGNGEYENAERLLALASFSDETPNAAKLNDTAESGRSICKNEAARKAEEEQIAREYKIHHSLPFVGLAESFIDQTVLGPSSRVDTNGYAYLDGHRETGTLYYFKNASNQVYFCVFCKGGRVAAVYDNRDGNSHYPGRLINGAGSVGHNDSLSSQSSNADPYHASDYLDEEEFYEDHWDDFFDFDDAEEYWRTHQ